jgi:hypothetical protein
MCKTILEVAKEVFKELVFHNWNDERPETILVVSSILKLRCEIRRLTGASFGLEFVHSGAEISWTTKCLRLAEGESRNDTSNQKE